MTWDRSDLARQLWPAFEKQRPEEAARLIADAEALVQGCLGEQALTPDELRQTAMRVINAVYRGRKLK
jgi:hypothetical protein